MNFIEWSEELSVGLNTFDAQHKVLLGLLNRLYTSMHEHEEFLVQEKILNELISYTETHFIEEEKYFAQFNYPDKENHIKEHKYLRDKIKSYCKDFYSGVEVQNDEVFDFLQKWLKNHIIKTDKKYQDFSYQKG